MQGLMIYARVNDLCKGAVLFVILIYYVYCLMTCTGRSMSETAEALCTEWWGCGCCGHNW